MKYKIIANPTAAKGESIRALPLLERELKRRGLAYDVVVTRNPWHAADLAQQAVVTGYDVVVAAGGDGTVNEVMNGLILARDAGLGEAALGVAPIGRGNDFAFGMGISQRVRVMVDVLAANERRIIDVGRISGGLYPGGRYFGNGVGIGLDASVNFVAASKKKMAGFAANLSAVLQTIAFDFSIPKVEITLDDRITFSQAALLISVMNGQRLGGGFYLAPGNRPDDGQFVVTIVNQISRARALTILPSLFNGSHLRHPEINSRLCHKVSVLALEGCLPVHADGEVIGVQTREVTVELFPAKIELVAPLNGPKPTAKKKIFSRIKKKSNIQPA